MKKKSSAIDSSDGENRFQRFEFWGVGPYFMLHYFGDDIVFQAFDYFGDSDAENALKASVVLMLQGKLLKGKSLFYIYFNRH